MPSTLLVYSTVDGHTRSICDHIASRLVDAGHDVSITPVEACDPGALASVDRVVVGASIRYGKYRPELVKFVRERADDLNARPSAFFTVNLVARKPGRDT
ncbi:MAG: flavodoxin domain-containing protein, partial [Phycisphaeraceae bacterium]|nr:flavodoxin domain-containing protein [Phycisphaeraceae bacterium]